MTKTKVLQEKMKEDEVTRAAKCQVTPPEEKAHTLSGEKILSM